MTIPTPRAPSLQQSAEQLVQAAVEDVLDSRRRFRVTVGQVQRYGLTADDVACIAARAGLDWADVKALLETEGAQ